MPSAAHSPQIDQPDMFGDVEQPLPPVAPPPEFTEFPEELLRRLNARIREFYYDEVMPWDEATMQARDDHFRLLVKEIHPDHRGDVLERWEAELARLRAGTEAARCKVLASSRAER